MQPEGKPRVKYDAALFANITAKPQPQAFEESSIAWMCQKYINEPWARTLGSSKVYTLQTLMRSPIGKVLGPSLKAQHIIDHARMRRASIRRNGTTQIKPATIGQDITYLRVVLTYAADMWDIKIPLEQFTKAKRQLVKEQLISKGEKRSRRPTPEEIVQLLAYFRKQDEHPRTVVPMAEIVEFAILTSRRISETCRIRWDDVNHEKKTCLVRDLKNSKGKGFHGVFSLLHPMPALAHILKRGAYEIILDQPRTSERIFPYNPKTCGKRFTDVCARLGIKDLRLHDQRHEALSRRSEEGYGLQEIRQGISLHRNTNQLDTYINLDPADLHKGPVALRQQEPRA